MTRVKDVLTLYPAVREHSHIVLSVRGGGVGGPPMFTTHDMVEERGRAMMMISFNPSG